MSVVCAYIITIYFITYQISYQMVYVFILGIYLITMDAFIPPKGWQSQGITIIVLILPSIYITYTPIKTCLLWAKRLLFCYKTWEKLIKFVKYGHILGQKCLFVYFVMHNYPYPIPTSFLMIVIINISKIYLWITLCITMNICG